MDGILVQTTRSIRALIDNATEGAPAGEIDMAYQALLDQCAAAAREGERRAPPARQEHRDHRQRAAGEPERADRREAQGRLRCAALGQELVDDAGQARDDRDLVQAGLGAVVRPEPVRERAAREKRDGTVAGVDGAP